jgi:hypothetical protein
MSLTAKVVRHHCQYGSRFERIALKGPELAMAFHDVMGIDVAIGTPNVNI